jgi:hypothetical protein
VTAISNNMRRKMAQMMAGPDSNLQIGLGGMAELENGETLPGSLRVAMSCNGIAMMMTPRQARALADTFDGRAAETKAHDLEWIPKLLREVADEIDAKVREHN